MFAFIAGRRSGKTAQVARWFWESPQERGILVADQKHKQNMQRELSRMTPATLDEYHYKHFVKDSVIIAEHYDQFRGRFPFRQIGIDDLDAVLGRLFGQYGQVEIVTATATLIAPAMPFHQAAANGGDVVDGDVVEDNDRAVEGYKALPTSPHFNF
jgi:hypothetical protein